MITALKQLAKMGSFKDVYLCTRDLNTGIKFNRDNLFIADNGRYKDIVLKPTQWIRLTDNDGIFKIHIIDNDKVKFSYKLPKIHHVTVVFTSGDSKTIFL